MAEGSWELLARACQLELAILVPALVAVLLVRANVRRRIGGVVAAEPRPRSIARGVACAGPAAGVIVACLLVAPPEDESSRAMLAALELSIECLAVAAIVGWMSPWSSTRAIGEQGLQLGWRAWAHAELDELRLAGSVLHVSVRDDAWTMPVAPQDLARVRELVERGRPAADA